MSLSKNIYNFESRTCTRTMTESLCTLFELLLVNYARDKAISSGLVLDSLRAF